MSFDQPKTAFSIGVEDMASLRQTGHDCDHSRDSSGAASKCASSPELMLASIPETNPSLFTASDGDFDFGSSIEDFLKPQELLTPHTGSVNISSYFQHDVSSLHSLASSLYFTPSSTENQSSSTGHDTSASGSDGPECAGCLKLGLQTLRALCAASLSHMCLFDEGSRQVNPQPRGMDSVLSTNKEAMESIGRMLDCHCIVMPALQMVVIIICDKIIAWYKAMLTPSKSAEPEQSSGLSSVAGKGLDLMYKGMGLAVAGERVGDEQEEEEETTEKVSSQPIQIGSFSPDPALVERIVACVVYYELQKFEGLLNQLASVNSNTVAGPALPFRKATHRNLVDLLRRRLLAAKTAASRRLEST